MDDRFIIVHIPNPMRSMYSIGKVDNHGFICESLFISDGKLYRGKQKEFDFMSPRVTGLHDIRIRSILDQAHIFSLQDAKDIRKALMDMNASGSLGILSQDQALIIDVMSR